jgi:hypothetical protein
MIKNDISAPSAAKAYNMAIKHEGIFATLYFVPVLIKCLVVFKDWMTNTALTEISLPDTASNGLVLLFGLMTYSAVINYLLIWRKNKTKRARLTGTYLSFTMPGACLIIGSVFNMPFAVIFFSVVLPYLFAKYRSRYMLLLEEAMSDQERQHANTIFR